MIGVIVVECADRGDRLDTGRACDEPGRHLAIRTCEVEPPPRELRELRTFAPRRSFVEKQREAGGAAEDRAGATSGGQLRQLHRRAHHFFDRARREVLDHHIILASR